MSLTKKDFKDLSKVIEVAIDQKFDEKFDQKFDEKFKPIKSDLSELKTKINSIEHKLDDLSEFTQEATGNILEWTDEIHTTIVKEQLVRRVKRLEKHNNLPSLAD